MKCKGWITGILGLWLLVAAFLRLDATAHSLNDIAVGLVVLVSSICIARAQPWQAWISAILAFWLLIAAFIPGLVQDIGLYLNNILVGLIVLAVGIVILAHARKLAVDDGAECEQSNFRSFGAE